MQPLFLVPVETGPLRVPGHQADGMAPGKQRPDDVLTKKAATSKNLVHRLSDDLLEGKGFAATSKSLEKAYSATYVKHFRSYVSLVDCRQAQLKGIYGQDTDVGDIPMFGPVGDPSGFNSNYPSAHYLRDIWHKWFYEIPVVQVWVTLYMCTLLTALVLFR